MFLIANFMGNLKKKNQCKKKPFNPLTVRFFRSVLPDCEVFQGKFGEKHYGNRVCKIEPLESLWEVDLDSFESWYDGWMFREDPFANLGCRLMRKPTWSVKKLKMNVKCILNHLNGNTWSNNSFYCYSCIQNVYKIHFWVIFCSFSKNLQNEMLLNKNTFLGGM